MSEINWRNMIENDIKKCEELIKSGRANQTDLDMLVEKYSMDIPSFRIGIANHIPGMGANEVENIKIVKAKLEYLLNRDEKSIATYKNNGNTFNFSQNNSNTNNISVTITLDEIREKIKDNTFLSEQDKNVLISKLQEIENLQKSNESRSKKWETAKKILSFILDKGADIAIMFIPQILAAL